MSNILTELNLCNEVLESFDVCSGHKVEWVYPSDEILPQTFYAIPTNVDSSANIYFHLIQSEFFRLLKFIWFVVGCTGYD